MSSLASFLFVIVVYSVGNTVYKQSRTDDELTVGHLVWVHACAMIYRRRKTHNAINMPNCLTSVS